MEIIDIYFLGVFVSLVVVFIIDVIDASNGVENKFDTKVDIITLTILIASSWCALIILILVLLIRLTKKFSKKI